MRIKTLFLAALTIFLVGIITGCSSPKGDFVHKTEAELAQMEKLNETAHQAFINGSYGQASSILAKLNSERTVSRPLYQLEQLSVLLMDGKNDEAHELMTKIHADLETLFDAKLEEKAQSVWHGEINKVFKGDSYERATFYAFMALSFIRKGNYEDALRCVKNGLLADADSNSEKAIDDFGLLHYLGFLAASKMNDRNEAEAYLSAMKKALQLRGVKTDTDTADCFSTIPRQTPNVILVVWAGSPPTVVCSGQYKEIRNIVHGMNVFNAMSIAVGDGLPVFTPNDLADIDFQATTRGGRLMDNVLSDKATAKAVAEVFGNVLVVVGTTFCLTCLRMMGSPPVAATMLGVGVGCLILGGTVHIVGSMMNPAADGRFWRNLPAQFYIVPLSLPAGKHQIMLQGYRNFDVAGITMHTIDVPASQGVNVIHLPMMTQGFTYAQALKSKHRKLHREAIIKADMDRLAKEIL